jgi:hypothetical protein
VLHFSAEHNRNQKWRLNARDIQDVEACITKGRESETEITKRALLVVQSYIGPEEDYLDHLNLVLNKFFKNNNKTIS